MKKTLIKDIKNLFDFEKGQLINFYCNNDNCDIINEIFNYYSDIGLYIDLWYNDELKKIITKSLNIGFLTSFQIIKKLEETTNKFVIIDSWELITHKDDWFINKLNDLAKSKKMIIIMKVNLNSNKKINRRTIKNLKLNLDKLNKNIQMINNDECLVY